jgi:hypothetical protein
MIQIFDWLNENENRAYPLLDSYNNKTYLINGKSWTLPDDLLVDLQLIVHNFLLKDETIYLKKINLTSESVDVLFTAESEAKIVTTFIINFDELSQSYIYKRNNDGCLAVFGKGLAAFKNACEGIIQTIELNIPVEFSTCYEFRNAWLGVKQITVAPEKNTNTDNYINPALVENIGLQNVTTSTILTGDVKFLEGYNFRVIIRNDLIDLEISEGSGLKTNCETHFIPAEYIDCDDIVSYINGIPPDENGNFKIVQGDNIVLTSGKTLASFNDSYAEIANQHTLFVSMVFSADNLCSPIAPTVL